jgi:D-glycero-D-manno-heptose 1,7-bisphosphate phosphatase
MSIVLLDRDGVINENHLDYVTNWDGFRFLAGAIAALAELQSHGLRLAIVSNQSAVGRGLMTEDDLNEIHERMACELAAAGVHLDGIFCCVHAPWNGCACRKPLPGLLAQALEALDGAPAEAVMIGDGPEDLRAASTAGVAFVLVRTGRGAETERTMTGRRPLVAVADDLPAATRIVLAHLAGRRANGATHKVVTQ